MFFWGDIIKKLFKAVFLLTIFSVISRLLGFLFKVYLTRLISTETLGLYSIVLSIFMVFVTLVSSGLPITISKLTASNKVQNNVQNTYSSVTGALIIQITFSIILTLVLLLFKNFFIGVLASIDSYYMLIALTPAIITSAIYSPFRGYLWGEKQYFKVSIVEFFEQLIKIIVLFVLTKLTINLNSMYPIGITISLSHIFSISIGVIFYFVCGGKLNRKQIEYKPIVFSSFPLTATRFCASLMSPLTSLILPLQLVKAGFTNSQALSMLGVAMGMTFPILTIPTTLIGSLATALIPEIATLLKQNNKEQLTHQINASILFTVCCSFLCFSVFLPLSCPICEFLFNNLDAGNYLFYSVWTIIPTGLSAITTSILNSLSQEKYTFRYFVYSAILSIITIFILPKFIGVHTLFVSIGLSMTITYLLNIYRINKTLNIKLNNTKYVFLLCIISLPTALLTKWVYNIFYIMYGNVISIILSSIICVICFIILLICFNIIDIKIILSSLKHKKVKQKQ